MASDETSEMSGPLQHEQLHSLVRVMVDQDKSTRHSAIDELETLIKTKEFSKQDCLDLWRGLFQCYWMCDNMLSQEQLCDRLCLLADSFPTCKGAYLYIRAGILTLIREWYCIDKWRYSKYLMLLRHLLRRYMCTLGRDNWNPQSIKHFNGFLLKNILTDDPARCTTFISFQVCSIFCEELSVAADSHLRRSTVTKLLAPFCLAFSRSRNKLFVNHLRDEMFDQIIDAAMSDFIEESATEADKLAVSKKFAGFALSRQEMKLLRSGIHLSDDQCTQLKISYSGIARKLFKFGSRKECPQYNRKQMYRLSEKFDLLANNVHPYASFGPPKKIRKIPKSMRLRKQIKTIKSLAANYQTILKQKKQRPGRTSAEVSETND